LNSINKVFVGFVCIPYSLWKRFLLFALSSAND